MLVDVAIPKPESPRVREADWIALVTMGLATTLQSLDQLRVLTVGIIALEVAIGAVAAGLGLSLPRNSLPLGVTQTPLGAVLVLPTGLVWIPLGVALVVAFLYNITQLSVWHLIDRGPSWTPDLATSVLIRTLESATLRNHALLEWGWHGVQQSLLLVVVGIISSGFCLLVLTVVLNQPEWPYRSALAATAPAVAALLAIAIAIGGITRESSAH